MLLTNQTLESILPNACTVTKIQRYVLVNNHQNAVIHVIAPQTVNTMKKTLNKANKKSGTSHSFLFGGDGEDRTLDLLNAIRFAWILQNKS